MSLPSFAVPVMVIEVDELPRTASGKVVKRDLRVVARKEWEVRLNKKKVQAKL